MNMKKLIISTLCALFLLLLLPLLLLSQGIGDGEGSASQMPEKPIIIPPSPSVASFQEFTSIPVSHFNGQAQYSITLAEVKSDIASFPITLSYKSSGIKVNEVASVCGLGWDISAGGVISRIINGKPDEVPIRGAWDFLSNYDFEPTYTANGWGSFENRILNLSITDCLNGVLHQGMDFWTYMMYKAETNSGCMHVLNDFELDLFSYSFLNYSGTFIISHNKKVYPLDDNGLAFICYCNAQGRICGFKAFDNEGREYQFGNIDGTENSAIENINSITVDGEGTLDYDAIQYYTSAWHLKKIKRVGYNDILSFEYAPNEEVSANFSHSISFNSSTPICSERKLSFSDSRSVYGSRKVSRITWPEGSIEFSYLFNQRLDMPNSKGAQLNEINVKNIQNDTIKKIKLNGNFIQSNNEIGKPNMNEGNLNWNHLKWRLFLQSVSISNDFDFQCIEYSFEYFDPFQMPYQKSYAQDLWGFYNGINNSTPFPNIEIPCSIDNMADRNVGDISFSRLGSLRKITYPTGGYSINDYEPNSFFNHSLGQDEIAGGLRVSSIEFGEKETTLLKKKYDYKLANGYSSGLIPLLNERRLYTSFSPMDFSACGFPKIKNNITEFPAVGYNSIKGNTVGYSRVEEASYNYITGSLNGKETFYYDTLYHEHFYRNITQISNSGLQNNQVLSSPYIDHYWKTGKLLKKEVYDSNNRILKKTINEYDYDFSQNDELIPYLKGTIFAKYIYTPTCGSILNVVYLSSSTLTFHLIPTKNRTRQTKTTSTDYFYTEGSVKSIETTTRYEYDDNIHRYSPSRIITRTESDSLYTRFKYVPSHYYSDFDLSVPFNHIRQQTGGKILQDTLPNSGFFQVFNAQYNPIKIKRYDTDLNQFIDWRTVNYNTNFKVSSIQEEGQPLESYLWDYNKTLPIAKVLNASPSDVFHTSFEGIGTVRINSKTGSKVCTTTFTAPLKNLTNQKYILSYWKLEGKWQYVISEINVNDGTCLINIPATSISPIDEVRFYPANSQMETYTWKPGVGVTSVTDPNNRTNYYEYDGLGRLTGVKDEDGNILQHNEYNYAQ
jgi:YD repeat-containing protein